MRLQKQADGTITLELFSIASNPKTVFKVEMLNTEGLASYILTPLYLVLYEGRTESHEQLFFCMRTGNSRRRRVRW